jgi:hypothetical protein
MYIIGSLLSVSLGIYTFLRGASKSHIYPEERFRRSVPGAIHWSELPKICYAILPSSYTALWGAPVSFFAHM